MNTLFGKSKQFQPSPLIFHLTPSSTMDSNGKFAFTSSSLQTTSDYPSSSPLLESMINFASWVGFVPFKVKFVKRESICEYQIIPLSLFRKLICFIIHASGILSYLIVDIQDLVFTDTTKFSSNFTHTFDLVTSFGVIYLTAAFALTFWRRQDELLEILQDSRVNYDERTRKKLLIFAFLCPVAAYAVSIYIYATYNPMYPQFLEHDLPDAASILDYLFFGWGYLRLIATYHNGAFAYYIYTFILMLTLSMKGVKKEFCEKMTLSIESMDMKTGFEHYMALKQLSSNITRTFGNSILAYYIISVAYFAMIPESSVWQGGGETTGMIFFFCLGAVIWLVSAEFHMKTRDIVQIWATEMQDLDDLTIDMRIRLLSVVNDNLLDPVGISCKFFTITYGFLGSMMGLIVTYAIIVFQMQAKPNTNSTSVITPSTTPSTLLGMSRKMGDL